MNSLPNVNCAAVLDFLDLKSLNSFSQTVRKHTTIVAPVMTRVVKKMIKQLGGCLKHDDSVCTTCNTFAPNYNMHGAFGCLACMYKRFHTACLRCRKTTRTYEIKLHDSTVSMCQDCINTCTETCDRCYGLYPFQMLRPLQYNDDSWGNVCNHCKTYQQMSDVRIVNQLRLSIRFKQCYECTAPTQNQHCTGYAYCTTCTNDWYDYNDFPFLPYFTGWNVYLAHNDNDTTQTVSYVYDTQLSKLNNDRKQSELDKLEHPYVRVPKWFFK